MEKVGRDEKGRAPRAEEQGADVDDRFDVRPRRRRGDRRGESEAAADQRYAGSAEDGRRARQRGRDDRKRRPAGDGDGNGGGASEGLAGHDYRLPFARGRRVPAEGHRGRQRASEAQLENRVPEE